MRMGILLILTLIMFSGVYAQDRKSEALQNENKYLKEKIKFLQREIYDLNLELKMERMSKDSTVGKPGPEWSKIIDDINESTFPEKANAANYSPIRYPGEKNTNI